MTERKRLKNELRKLQYYKKSLPRLIDCSEVYGDFYYDEKDLKIVDKEIELLTLKIKEIDETENKNKE